LIGRTRNKIKILIGLEQDLDLIGRNRINILIGRHQDLDFDWSVQDVPALLNPLLHGALEKDVFPLIVCIEYSICEKIGALGKNEKKMMT
jgi:hypothetical protein